MGTLIDRVHRELTYDDISKIADTYHAWRGDNVGADLRVSPDAQANTQVRAYEDIPGFCKSATTDDIRGHNYILTPGRYVGAAEVEDDGEPFEEKMKRLVDQWHEQQAEAARLDKAIAKT